MASGKQIGEFSMKFTSITYTPGPAGSVLIQANCEGPAAAFGALFGTATFVGGPRDGTFSWCGTNYPDTGDPVTGIGAGTYESVGRYRWSTQLNVQLSDGRSVVDEGEIDLAKRSWTGKIFERS